jgi:hypothetical protein
MFQGINLINNSIPEGLVPVEYKHVPIEVFSPPRTEQCSVVALATPQIFLSLKSW